MCCAQNPGSIRQPISFYAGRPRWVALIMYALRRLATVDLHHFGGEVEPIHAMTLCTIRQIQGEEDESHSR